MAEVSLTQATVQDSGSLQAFEMREVWVAKLGEVEGVGQTKGDALRSLGNELDTRSTLAAVDDEAFRERIGRESV